ncbi:efflux RND transporter permease subunit [Oceanicola sp. 502str15]|uniref:efflux RND transporter permease subunit n=1 Tax=Oceanicola sp. 502str15 TaxID=2696061 RepID=UPI0020953B94|nr:efflux RND transporter permease subunit [Oceanicola sp. 502str15]MCO6382571.1 AcrB/AcrD/AcrF family protein [Oceanicola sp. 502str15]
MTGIVDWAAARARMILAFVAMSILVGWATYLSLPKEGEPDIEIPAVFVSVPFPGISATDAEKMLVKPMETELSDLDGLKTMTGVATEGYANVVLEFEFGWDKSATLADVRAAMNTAEANFPSGADNYTIGEINFSEFPIIIVNLTGALPERTLVKVAKDLQDSLEGLEPVLEASLAGHRDEMLEVVIDPLKLESYNVTAAELINVVVNNNQLIAAGEIETPSGAFSVKIPASFEDGQDVYDLPVKVNGDSIVTLGDLADIRLTFEDRVGTARFNGVNTVALQVSKKKGYNIIDTAAAIRATVDAEMAKWPPELRDAIQVGTSNDQSRVVKSMVAQLEGSVMTAIALVAIVVLAALGIRPAMLVGIAIPISFLLCFVFLSIMGITVSNIVMFGLILAVGMLVDGAIVVVEYADKRISEGVGPMHAYVEAAKRMFWPIVSSTATTLCAFLPMLFWPGVAGQFMGMLPVTLIFVLSASLLVALVYLPVLGGVSGRMSRSFHGASQALRRLPWWVRAVLVVPSLYLLFIAALQCINPGYLFGGESPLPGMAAMLPGLVLFVLAAFLATITLTAAKLERAPKRVSSGHRRTAFGWLIKLIAGNPVMPLVTVAAVVGFVVFTFGYYGANNNGVDFFVESEPEQAIVYVRARGNLSLEEKDLMVKEVEDTISHIPGIESAFSFAGEGGLNSNTGGSQAPLDTVGQIQLELIPWEDRPEYARTHDVPLAELDGDVILEKIEQAVLDIPGIQPEILNLAMGPGSGKPIHLRLSGDDFAALEEAVGTVRAEFESLPGIIDLEDTTPLPGIDWQIDVDVEKAGRYGADVATVGAMVQLVTRGILLDTMRVDSSDEEIEIRVRLPYEDRVLSTLDELKVRTAGGLVPLSNFISRQPVPKIGRIDRVDQRRVYDVKADVAAGLTKLVEGEGEEAKTLAVVPAEEADALIAPGGRYAGASKIAVNANERIGVITEWLSGEESPLPLGIDWEWTGDQEDQEESGQFLMSAFGMALGMMFIILLAQFNSFYNSVLVLLAVVLSTAGVLWGMLLLGQPFSIIMTGTGIVALAGIVVNNNIVLIDTYQEFSAYMPRLEAVIRTAEARLRPVLLTTITTMAGLTPMMLGLSLDFVNGGYSLDSPTALWWKQLATAVVFGLGTATILTLVFTPSMLALRIWASKGAYWGLRGIGSVTLGRSSRIARDASLARAAHRVKSPEIIWSEEALPEVVAEPQAAPEAKQEAEEKAADSAPEKPADAGSEAKDAAGGDDSDKDGEDKSTPPHIRAAE